jgi:hypothetical protein
LVVVVASVQDAEVAHQLVPVRAAIDRDAVTGRMQTISIVTGAVVNARDALDVVVGMRILGTLKLVVAAGNAFTVQLVVPVVAITVVMAL